MHNSSTCTFNVTDEKGQEIDNTTIATNGRLLVKYLREIEGSKKLTLEECELSNWLYEILRPEVDELIVCNPVANKDYKNFFVFKIITKIIFYKKIKIPCFGMHNYLSIVSPCFWKSGSFCNEMIRNCFLPLDAS